MREVIQSPENEIHLSMASAWEISIKYGIGRLRLPEPPATYLPHALDRSGALILGITLAHATRVSDLPPHHRDPFDRLIVAQAQVEQMALLSVDSALRAYEVDLIDR